MRKRAGSFLKNMMNKGKGLFKKDEEGKEQTGDNGFDSEEDNDIIEVGKSGSGLPRQMPGSSFSSLGAASTVAASSLSVSGVNN